MRRTTIHNSLFFRYRNHISIHTVVHECSNKIEVKYGIHSLRPDILFIHLLFGRHILNSKLPLEVRIEKPYAMHFYFLTPIRF